MTLELCNDAECDDIENEDIFYGHDAHNHLLHIQYNNMFLVIYSLFKLIVFDNSTMLFLVAH